MVGAVAKKARFTEGYPARFVPGTAARMEAVLGTGEDRADFIRDAVERELARRERAIASSNKPGKT